MRIRASFISNSILGAISDDPEKRTLPQNVIDILIAFFSFFELRLARYRAASFLTLRHDAWRLDEEAYRGSFRRLDSESELIPVGDLGYSGSTFFTTRDSRYLIKSLPRRFEHEFFTHDLFDAYVTHMKSLPDSLLVRITDMVYTPYPTLGGIIGTAPTHHIVMENLLSGKELDVDEDGESRWETYDLKPNDYFFPERDIADGRLVPDSVMERLLDEFPGKIHVSSERKNQLLRLLEADTKLLAEHNAVDYSLFLVRYPGPGASERPRSIPTMEEGSMHIGDWRSGLDDARGLWTYRMVVLDFFWAKHKLHAKAMTGLVNTFNLIANKGPMSITAEPAEYRQRFLRMIDEMVLAED